jgi:hypothetical protein
MVTLMRYLELHLEGSRRIDAQREGAATPRGGWMTVPRASFGGRNQASAELGSAGHNGRQSIPAYSGASLADPIFPQPDGVPKRTSLPK